MAEVNRSPLLLSRRQLALALGLGALHGGVAAQGFPISPGQRATAQQVAQGGVPLADLAADAPDSYTVKPGDTLWAIAGVFLRAPWRWPELWGMNLQDIRNPHLIYPGQQLVLDRDGGRARLRAATTPAQGDVPALVTVRVSPRTRIERLTDSAVPTLKPHLIEPFLSAPIIVDEDSLQQAARIVATLEDRVLLTKGNRAYARGSSQPLSDAPGEPLRYRVFRNAVALKDPISAEILGYEAQYVGTAQLVRGEAEVESQGRDGRTRADRVPATIDITGAIEEIRVGDRLLPEPPRQLQNYIPRAPAMLVEGARVVSVYGSAVANAAQNQVVVINRGTNDGIESGHVLAIQTDGASVVDRTDPARPALKLPDERNGLLMVFRPFERVSYALILEIRTGVNVGDRLINPR